jgi:hypothetical protein
MVNGHLMEISRLRKREKVRTTNSYYSVILKLPKIDPSSGVEVDVHLNSLDRNLFGEDDDNETLVRVPKPKTSYRKRIITGFKDGDDLPPLRPETMGMRNPGVYNLKW